jgi:hypothetical protein
MSEEGRSSHIVAPILWFIVCFFTVILGIALVAGVVVDDAMNGRAFGFALIGIAIAALIGGWLMFRK